MSRIQAQEIIFLIISSLVFLAVIYLVELVFMPNYWIKSAIKISLIALIVLLYSMLFKVSVKETIFFEKLHKPWIFLTIIAGVVALSLLIFFIFKNQIDLDSIRESMFAKEKLSKRNAVLVYVYIVFVNSFFEEALFRGLLFGFFRRKGLKAVGYIVPNLLFSAYHVGIVASWFNPFIFILCISGLVGAGALLCFISDKFGSIKASWIMHGSANLVINGIGCYLIMSA